MKDAYVLGRSARELDRLDLQGILYRDITYRALVGCGIEAGMRLLDIGCGSGDLSRLGRDLVGPSGMVLGIDNDADSVRSASERMARQGVTNVAFAVADAASVAMPGSFDAVVARFFLMHQRSPADALAAAARAVRPGGVIMMLESHLAALLDARHSYPPSALYDEVVRWECRVVAAAGADIEAGLRLYRTFESAKLPAPEMHMESVIGGGPDSLIYRYMAESVRSMLPMAEKHGISGFDSESVDLLESRLRDEVVRDGGVLVCWPVVSAWCRKAM